MTKNLNPDFFLGVVDGSYGSNEHESRHILFTRHIVVTSSTEPYSFIKIIMTVFKIESFAAETIKGK